MDGSLRDCALGDQCCGLPLEGESEGDTDGAAFDRAYALDLVGDGGLSKVPRSSSSMRLSGRAGYAVPFSVARVFAVPRDFAESGDQGLLSAFEGGLLDATLGDFRKIEPKKVKPESKLLTAGGSEGAGRSDAGAPEGTCERISRDFVEGLSTAIFIKVVRGDATDSGRGILA